MEDSANSISGQPLSDDHTGDDELFGKELASFTSNPSRILEQNFTKSAEMKMPLFLCFLTFLSFVTMGQSVLDKKSVNQVVEAFVRDYNDGDFKNASFYTTPDWVHINPGGGITSRREDVLKEVRAIHQTMLKGVRITIDTLTTRFLTVDVAVVNAVHTSDPYITPEDGVRHEYERQIKTYIVVRQKGKWLLTLDQNTIVSNP